MRNENNGTRIFDSACLTEEEFYNFVAQPERDLGLAARQNHLASCTRCREELAGLLRILYPESVEMSETLPQPTAQDIDQTLELIKTATRNEAKATTTDRRWYLWAAAAAALVVSVGALALNYYVENQRSRNFYGQARTQLEQVYSSESPNGLRLNLPFQSSATRRASPDDDSLNSAENSFYQALAVREGMQEARLGLGYVYLSRGQFSKAREKFQEVLGQRARDMQATLGRGVTLFEEGLASKDPVERSARMESALSDFESILKQNPLSSEARYNKVLTLYQVGRHKQALEEIAAYLAHDSSSLWAEKLKTLETQIRMTRSEAVEAEVDRAAAAGDGPALRNLARLVPYQLPAAIRGSLQQSLALEGASRPDARPGARALRWAAEVMDSSYGEATGDRSGTRLLDFYDGLSPPRRQAKRSLDARLKRLIDLHREGKLQTVIRESEPLIREFETLQDHWQLVNLHHLRGICLYYQSADFDSTLSEYRKMHSSAENSASPDLIARALATLASIYTEKRRFDDALTSLTKLKTLAATYRMDPWLAHALRNLGGVYLSLNQFEQSLQHYSLALDLAYRLMNESITVPALENLGVVLEKMDRLPEARSFYQDANRWQDFFIKEGTDQAAPARFARSLNLLYKQGSLAFRMKDLTAAESFFRNSLESSKSGMKELEARNRLGLAQVYLAQGRTERATDELQKIETLTAIGKYPELEWQAQTLLGSVCRLNGDSMRALAHFQRAIQILEEICETISSNDFKQTFLNHRFDPYQEIVSLSYRFEKDKVKTLDYVDRAKMIRLREYLEEHRDWFDPTSQAGARQKVTPNNISTLEYFLAADELFIFISAQGRLETAALRISPAELEREVESYLDSIKSNNRASFEAQSRRLYDQLLEPVINKLDLRTTETLVIFPDGPLHLIPFAGLKDSEGRYLVEKHAIAYAPSRRIFDYCLSLDKESAAGPKRTMLLLDGSANLRGASDELAHLARLYGRNALIATRDLLALKHQTGDFEIIHFSGHATNSQGKPSLEFSYGSAKGYLDAHAIGSWNLRKNRLVTLAGCNTGVGPRVDGKSSWGLLPAFLRAGSPALMVSLLPVGDTATRNLTASFYDLMVQGSLTKAKALQQAQLSLLRNSRPEVSALLSWIPFVLVGDPR